MDGGFAALRKRSAFRRTVAVVCAAALLIVAFAHLMQHSAVPASSAAHEITIAADNSSPPDSEDGHGSGHCHGCVTVAFGDEVVLATFHGKHQVPTLEPTSIRPYLPIGDTPFPIAII